MWICRASLMWLKLVILNQIRHNAIHMMDVTLMGICRVWLMWLKSVIPKVWHLVQGLHNPSYVSFYLKNPMSLVPLAFESYLRMPGVQCPLMVLQASGIQFWEPDSAWIWYCTKLILLLLFATKSKEDPYICDSDTVYHLLFCSVLFCALVKRFALLCA